MSAYLGIDIGGTNVKMGIVDKTQRTIRNFYSHDTEKWRESKDFVERLIEAITLQLLENKGIREVGIGIPGILSQDRGTPIEITAIPELNNQPLKSILEKRFFDVEFFIENDANAAALGEYYFGEGTVEETYIFITLGTGVGGAAIINKKIFIGGNGNAMEPGHMPSKNSRTLERNIGKNAILDLATQRRKDFKEYTLLPLDGISTTGLVAAASEEDALAKEIFNEVGFMLGESLVSLIRILDIETVLIGGGLSASFDYILPSVQERLNYWLTPHYVSKLKIKRATLGNDAGLLGAAALCF